MISWRLFLTPPYCPYKVISGSPAFDLTGGMDFVNEGGVAVENH